MSHNGSLGKRVRDLRARARLSQPALARKAGVGVATVNEIERGKRIPQVVTLQKIAEALGVERSELEGIAS